MERVTRGWRHEALRVVPVVLGTMLSYLLQALLDGQYWSLAINSAALVAGLIAMRWRHRWPVTLTVVLCVLMVPLPGLWLVAGWSYFSLATRARPRTTVLVGLVAAVCFAVQTTLLNVEGPLPGSLGELSSQQLAVVVALTFSSTVALGAIGSYLGSRTRERQMVVEKLALAEREQELARQHAKAEERSRIAREMHDVLAHKITLISLHAGALAYRGDLSPDEVRQAGETIRDSSDAALAELRMILGQLRQTEDGAPIKPQPTLADLDALVAGHREAGHRVVVEDAVVGEPGQTLSRHAYRVVQEGLTNAARHAPGTQVTISLDGAPGEGLHIRITNLLSLAPPRSPGAGMGLIGLRERVEIAGGTMTAGEEDGQFVVDVRFEWEQP